MTASPINPGENRAARDRGDEMLTLQEACAFLRLPEGTLRFVATRSPRFLAAELTEHINGKHPETWSSPASGTARRCA